jgi:hypothetical protein
MNKIAAALCISFTIFSVGVVSAADVVEVEQLSRIAGNKPSKISKIAEAMDKEREACRLARGKNFEQAMQILDEITVVNDFDYQSERYARITKIDTMVLKGDYKKAYEIVSKLNAERRMNIDYVAFIKAMSDFEATGESQYLVKYIDQYNERNKNIIPPKVYDLNYLRRTVRLFEMAGEIDQALVLVEQYNAAYFPKNGFKKEPSGIVKKRREGLKLLKEALLRDKQEGKNIYAQELINTTDYFGFG